MTVPTNIIFPRQADSPEYLQEYIKKLNFSLQRMYEQLAQGINGDIGSDFGVGRQQWKPLLKGTTVEGTFVYDHQIGWSLRQGLITDVWLDISWSSAGAASGNLFVELPYKVALSNQKPFVGTAQSSVFAYTGGTGIVINGIPDTYRGEFWNTGSAFTTANQTVVSSGQIIAHLRYIGKANERA